MHHSLGSNSINYGEFSISAPAGKAYMLGEFGHILEHAEDHWDIAKQYAGGFP